MAKRTCKENIRVYRAPPRYALPAHYGFGHSDLNYHQGRKSQLMLSE